MKKGILAEMYDELRKTKYPVFIIGAGSMSVEVANRLKEQQIPVIGKFVDTEISASHIIPDGGRIFSLKEISEQYGVVDVVMGHGHYEKKKDIENYPFVHKVYIIPNPYPQYMGPDKKFVHKDKIDYVMEHLADDKSKLALEKYIAVNETDDITRLMELDTGGVCMAWKS